MLNKAELIEHVRLLTGINQKPSRLNIVSDTSDWMRINPGDVLYLNDRYYAVRGNAKEDRFGIEEQPKYWVFNCVDIQTGKDKIIKTVFHEEFHTHIGIFRIRCYRSPQKESSVLDLVQGKPNFMNGFTVHDDLGNNIRIIDYIKGKTLFNYIPTIDKSHEQYFIEDFPTIIKKLYDLFQSIVFIQKEGFCHGDIRTDHIIIESETNLWKWIDFDLMQDFSDFDLWSFGNIINYAASKGIKTFDQVLKNNEFSDDIKNTLTKFDGAAFYNYRIINLAKLYKYIPEDLNKLLLHFSRKPIAYFKNIDEFNVMFENVIGSNF